MGLVHLTPTPNCREPNRFLLTLKPLRLVENLRVRRAQPVEVLDNLAQLVGDSRKLSRLLMIWLGNLAREKLFEDVRHGLRSFEARLSSISVERFFHFIGDGDGDFGHRLRPFVDSQW